MLFYFSGGLITICATIACMSESFQTKFLWTYGLLCLYCLYKVRISHYFVTFLGYLNFHGVYLCLIFEMSILEFITNSKKKINFETNSIFRRVRTWFLQATQAVKIKFELNKKSSLFRNRYFFEFEIEKKSSDTRYYKNQVEIDRGKG